MKIKSLIIPIILLFLPFLVAWTTNQKCLVHNITRQELIDELEYFVVNEGYSFDYANPDKGLFRIYVKTTSKNSYYADPSGLPIIHGRNKSTKWMFTFQIADQYNDGYIVIGKSHGGLAPGKYFGKFMKHLEESGHSTEKLK